MLLVLAGCGAGAGERIGPPPDPLRGVTFVSSEITVDGKSHELMAGAEVSLLFTDDGRLSARAGCNTMGGDVRTDGGTLEVDELAMTGAGCAPPGHARDEWLAEVLGAKPSWRLDGPELTVRTGATELVLVDREIAEPDLSLAETKWVVVTILDGQTASSTPAGATATLVFGERRVDIFGGCNSGSAGYTMSGDTIRFEAANLTLKACEPDIMRLEAAVLDVVHDEVAFEIDADRLRMTQPSGKGLELRAE